METIKARAPYPCIVFHLIIRSVDYCLPVLLLLARLCILLRSEQ